ncbi:hypothetical protein PSHT_14748 [Puccinia striiformis]|uniref:Alpha-type protein kinase domain-containing protein n=1 Tax=Puccinia striiformis TaxID=27350 RepID=A0A2S4UIV5_9BASI|nr:hypothetical protein PSHT_14748 [Puccinia striiformis]
MSRSSPKTNKQQSSKSKPSSSKKVAEKKPQPTKGVIPASPESNNLTEVLCGFEVRIDGRFRPWLSVPRQGVFFDPKDPNSNSSLLVQLCKMFVGQKVSLGDAETLKFNQFHFPYSKLGLKNVVVDDQKSFKTYLQKNKTIDLIFNHDAYADDHPKQKKKHCDSDKESGSKLESIDIEVLDKHQAGKKNTAPLQAVQISLAWIRRMVMLAYKILLSRLWMMCKQLRHIYPPSHLIAMLISPVKCKLYFLSHRSHKDSHHILLTPTNYGIWILPMQSKLEQIGVLSMLEDNVPVKTDADKAAILELSAKAYHLVIVHLGPEVLAYVSSVYSSPTRFNGYALWHLLKSHYAGGDLASQTTALAKFNHLAFTSIAKFIPDVQSANQAINMSGCVFDDCIRVNQMLSKLPSEFQSFHDIISMSSDNHTFEAVLKKLENYVAMNNLDHKASSPATLCLVQTAMNTQSEKPNNSSGSVCEHCKTPGDHAVNCWKKFPEKAPKSHQAHMTISNNANQLASQESQGDFSWFRTADGVRHHVDEMRFEGVHNINPLLSALPVPIFQMRTYAVARQFLALFANSIVTAPEATSDLKSLAKQLRIVEAFTMYQDEEDAGPFSPIQTGIIANEMSKPKKLFFLEEYIPGNWNTSLDEGRINLNLNDHLPAIDHLMEAFQHWAYNHTEGQIIVTNLKGGDPTFK